MKNKYWIFVAVAAVVCFSSPASGWAASALDAAESFAVIASAGIVDDGNSDIVGDVGVRPGSVTGLDAGQVSGVIYTDGMPLKKAQSDIGMLYDLAIPTIFPYAQDLTATPDLDGMILPYGAYRLNDAQLNGTLSLDGEGNTDNWWVFLIDGTLNTGDGSSIEFINDVNDGDTYGLYWAVGDSATLGEDSLFLGNLLAMNDITLGNNAEVYGRLLSRNGTVTLNSNYIDQSEPIGSPGYSGGNLPWFDGYPYSEANPIPEPATMSLLGLGLLGLAFRKKKALR